MRIYDKPKSVPCGINRNLPNSLTIITQSTRLKFIKKHSPYIFILIERKTIIKQIPKMNCLVFRRRSHQNLSTLRKRNRINTIITAIFFIRRQFLYRTQIIQPDRRILRASSQGSKPKHQRITLLPPR